MTAAVLSDKEREVLRAGDTDEARQLLAAALGDGRMDLPEMGAVAVDLFRAARYSLASMLFAHWTAREPENPEPWANLGLCLLRQNDLENARQVLEYALEIGPDLGAARMNLCDAYRELGLYELQLATAEDCVRRLPGSALALNNLGSALLQNGRPADAREAFAASLQVDPDYFEARFNVARMASDEGDHAAAIEFYESALRSSQLDSRRREVVEHHLSFEYLNQGRLAEGWALYERGFSPLVPPSLARRPDRRFHMPRWDGRPLENGQTLLLWREQGIGDELRFLALLPLLDIGKGKLVIETESRLVDVLQRSFPKATVRVPQADGTDSGRAVPNDADCHLPIGSLPGLFMNSPDVYAKLGGYLQAAPWQSGRFAQRLARFEGKRKVGICWRSHKLSATRNRKYTSLDDWVTILSMPDTAIVNLQYGDCEQELVAMERKLGIEVVRWKDVNLKDDLDAVLGLMQNLDLVISPSTAVVPMAGALGRPTLYLGHANWMLLGQKNRYPWFSSVTPLLVPSREPVWSALAQVPALITP